MVIKRFYKWLQGPTFYMGGGESSAPAAPDPYKLADAQARYNRYSQYTPFGHVAWKNKGSQTNPKWVQTTKLNAGEQKVYDTDVANRQGTGSLASSYLDSQLKPMLSQSIYGSQGDTRDRVEKALMDRLNPYLQRDQEQLNSRLANQGIAYGNEPYTKAQDDMSRRINDARLAAIAQAGQEEQRQQQIDLAARSQGINELNSLLGFSKGVNVPVAANTMPIDIAGMMQNQYNAQLGASNASQAGKNNMLGSGMGALGTIGGSFFGK